MFKSVFGSASVFFIAVLAIFASSAFAKPPTGPRTVNCSNDSLQEEIDESETNDVLELVGDCVGSVVIAIDGLTLDGLGTATITGDGLTRAVTVTANRVVVKNLASIEGGASEAISVEASGSAEFNTVASIKGFRGARVSQSAFANFVGSSLSDSPTPTTGHGLVVTDGGHARLEDTDVTGNAGRGIFISNTGSVALANDNAITGNTREGIIILHGALSLNGTGNTGSGNNGAGDDVRCFDFSRISVTNSFTDTGSVFRSNCALSLGPPVFTPPAP